MTDERYDYFGDPNAPKDIARSDSVVDDLFIETSAIAWFLRRDPEYHIIVGSKGTGKSLLLFKKAVLATKKSGIVVAPGSPQKAYSPGLTFAESERWVPYWPLTDDDGRPLLVQWASLWEWALLVTICSAWRDYAERQRERILLGELEQLLEGIEQDNPFALIAGALQTMATKSGQVMGQARLPNSAPFHRFMLRHVGKLPPPYVFLDNQDDLFFDYPDFWKASGQGCFLAIQQLHEVSNHRIHIFVTLRPEIVWELSKMQHYPQWTADIFHIQWQDDELIDVLRRRSRYLKRDLLPSPELRDRDPLHAFLGQDLYDSKRRDFYIRVPLVDKSGAQEAVIPVRDHLLRHTLRRPREIIILGNAILDARRRAAGTGEHPATVIRDAVDRKAANDIAKPYLAEIKHRWPWGAQPDQNLRHFVARHVNKNVLSKAEVRAIEQEFSKQEGVTLDTMRPFTQLASLGLIGWPVEDPQSGRLVQHFVLPGEQDVDALPTEIRWFLVHPILYAAPFHIGVVPGNVIGPGLPFDPSKQRVAPKYYTAYICCAQNDRRFAKKLSEDLQAWGVRSFLPGADLPEESEARHDVREDLGKGARVLVICSVDGLESRELLQELSEISQRQDEAIMTVSRDREWQSPEFQVAYGGRDLKRCLTNRSGACFERGVKYGDGLRELLKALERKRRRASKSQVRRNRQQTAGH